MFSWVQRLFTNRASEQPGSRNLESSSTPTIPAYATIPESRSGPIWLSRLPERILFVDVETTGLESRDRVVSIGCLLLQSSSLATEQMNVSWLHAVCDPGVKSHPRAEAVHGYDDWTLRHQQPFSEIVGQVGDKFFAADLVVGHNLAFDLKFIGREFDNLGKPLQVRNTFCTMQGWRAKYPGSPAGLAFIAAELGIPRQGSHHGALEDAWLAMQVYLRLLTPLRPIPFSQTGLEREIKVLDVPPRPDGPLPRRKRKPKAEADT